MNTLKVGLLLATLTLLFVLLGGWIGGTAGMIVALALALVMNVGSYWYSDRIVLRMTGAEPLSRRRTRRPFLPLCREALRLDSAPVNWSESGTVCLRIL